MKAKLTIYVFFICFCAGGQSIKAQATIGMDAEPNKGAILDLKQEDVEGENSQLGLILPRITLSSLDKFGLVTDATADYKAYKGLVIYHESNQESPAITEGIYIWDGSKWVFTPSKWSREDIEN